MSAIEGNSDIEQAAPEGRLMTHSGHRQAAGLAGNLGHKYLSTRCAEGRGADYGVKEPAYAASAIMSLIVSFPTLGIIAALAGAARTFCL